MRKGTNKNLAPKIISIIFALVLWIYVIGTINPKTDSNFSNIPVRLINMEELKEQKLTIKNGEEFRVKVKVIGRRDEINKITANQIQIRADLRGSREGINNIPLEATVPNNIEVDINPRFIRVELEKVTSRERRVKVITTGTPKDGFIVGNLQYEPSMVEIEGPESYVNSVESVVAELDVSKLSKNLVLSLPLKPVNSRGEEVANVDVKTSYTKASLLIDLLKTVPIKPNLQTTVKDGYTITSMAFSSEEVVLRGQEELLSGITEVTTERIKIENLSENKRIDVKLNLPEGVTLYNDIPITIDLYLEKLEEAVYKINKDKIIFKNIDEKLRVDMSSIPENIDIKVIALKKVLDSIRENDIKIVVDLNDLNANEHTIELSTEIPYAIESEIKELHLNPKTINIKLVDK